MLGILIEKKLARQLRRKYKLIGGADGDEAFTLSFSPPRPCKEICQQLTWRSYLVAHLPRKCRRSDLPPTLRMRTMTLSNHRRLILFKSLPPNQHENTFWLLVKLFLNKKTMPFNKKKKNCIDGWMSFVPAKRPASRREWPNWIVNKPWH